MIKLTIRLPEEDKELLAQDAKCKGTSLSVLVRTLIQSYLAQSKALAH